MNKPIELLLRQKAVNVRDITELHVYNQNHTKAIEENNEAIAIIEASNVEIDIAVEKLKENV